jgi:hypothetical protein
LKIWFPGIEIEEAVNLPILTGEDIYLADGFYEPVSNNAVDIGHPDLGGVGGIFETKRVGDLCRKFGLPIAMHSAGSPICALAAVHGPANSTPPPSSNATKAASPPASGRREALRHRELRRDAHCVKQGAGERCNKSHPIAIGARSFQREPRKLAG